MSYYKVNFYQMVKCTVRRRLVPLETHTAFRGENGRNRQR